MIIRCEILLNSGHQIANINNLIVINIYSFNFRYINIEMRHKKDIITKENQTILKMWSNKNLMMKNYENI